ncbi:hypothetical protein [Candidatus Nitrosacidococcus sp. I8]|uniref:hypothetical protein n=1 Tax=Candidatus Nitrosacidococcus sp. I8 TaxID=2942908 RepID=UPI0022272F56|nr:hypothetical protein [Candidatus Nitrosacidococcus sp. I8]CAH9018880.1 hypothetical protein NURINAE_01195 [Candidatus Nitrosacidococcus sp. I8]
MVFGIFAKLVIPAISAIGASEIMRLWHRPDKAQNILAGLALVAAMSIAGSSTV